MSDPFRVKGLTRSEWRLVLFVPLSVLGVVGAMLYPGFENWRAGATTPCGELLSDQEVLDLTGREVDKWMYSKGFFGCSAAAYSALDTGLVTLNVKSSCKKPDWTREEGFESVSQVNGFSDIELATLKDGYRIHVPLKPSGCITSALGRDRVKADSAVRLAGLLASRREPAASYVRELD